ncbi:hybrid sensor histidine kinase/response regulator [Litoribrevibacter albus]|uniref:histidine kinase n=1 Tax=Litoribrevibacter albus TaxID=1473156 RepID=A0AA37S7F2_9GAMM|nr:PAS domain-containing hybrid sensor histidine kinase/response regulator [Litoribrevibacter albus]GLQ29573.1 two-component sensor [Litoribrevibacter albus]
MSTWLIAFVSFGYVCLLFFIAWRGDRTANIGSESDIPHSSPWVYSLTLGVYCTTWTFFGAVGQAAQNLWSFLPIYLGPILVFLLMWRFYARLILVSRRENITSIADFISARYGKHEGLAMLVTVIAAISVLPYIALQLKALVMGYIALTGNDPTDLAHINDRQDIALTVAVTMAIFAIFFGTRHMSANEHHRGLMHAIAFESVVKLVAFLILGGFVTYGLFDGVGDLLAKIEQQATNNPQIEHWLSSSPFNSSMLVQVLLAAGAFICLPRQFHVAMVENTHPRDFLVARWIFPAYLILVGLFVIPLVVAGKLLFGDSVSADTYVLMLPIEANKPGLSLLVFLGGFSAATSMVIVSTVALSIMVSNHIVLPFLLRKDQVKNTNYLHFRGILLNARRTTILMLLFFAYLFYRFIENTEALATIGQIAFAAVVQLAPAMIGALLWQDANRSGVIIGLVLGVCVWFYTLILPIWIEHLPWLASLTTSLPVWLRPQSLLTIEWFDPVTRGAALSLLFNLTGFIIGSRYFKTHINERIQAARFQGTQLESVDQQESLLNTRITQDELNTIASRFVEQSKLNAIFTKQPTNERASQQEIEQVEHLMSAVIGAASARAVLNAAISGQHVPWDDVEAIASETSETLQVSRELLQHAIQNMGQGISVIDKELKLLAWNHRYLELFNYPQELIQVGMPIEQLIRYNAQRGLCGSGDVEGLVQKRIRHLQNPTEHVSEREREDGTVIQLRGNPLPDGGFVMSFNDITTFRQAEQALLNANEALEERVQERTDELRQLNRQLIQMTQKAEQTSASKSRFIAAVSHDLMQPMNAARLFTSALMDDLIQHASSPEHQRQLSSSIDQSLRSAEDMLTDLLDISRLESGNLKVSEDTFALDELLGPMIQEFRPMAEQANCRLSYVKSSLRVTTDRRLLRRIVQNFMTNAIRYSQGCKVLLGCRTVGDKVSIQVWDTGPGIPEADLGNIFNAFTQLNEHQRSHDRGLGLGLAIAKGFSDLLDGKITVASELGKGSRFTLELPTQGRQKLASTSNVASTLGSSSQTAPLSGIDVPAEAGQVPSQNSVLCIDNEPEVLKGMTALLSRWGYQVLEATNTEDAVTLAKQQELQMVLIDYHLDQGQLGTDALIALRNRASYDGPAIFISADGRTNVKEKVSALGCKLLSKPIKPAKLRALMQSLST